MKLMHFLQDIFAFIVVVSFVATVTITLKALTQGINIV